MEGLPHDAAVEVLCFLEAREISACAAVSSAWRAVANSPFVWRDLCARRWRGASAPALLRMARGPGEVLTSAGGGEGATAEEWREAYRRMDAGMERVLRQHREEKRVREIAVKAERSRQLAAADDLIARRLAAGRRRARGQEGAEE